MDIKIPAKIVSISDEIKTKSTKDGTPGADYVVCIVEFTGGKLSGKTFFAQRTLGEKKAAISVGQSVFCYAQVVNGVPYFEISTGANVSDAAEIAALLQS